MQERIIHKLIVACNDVHMHSPHWTSKIVGLLLQLRMITLITIAIYTNIWFRDASRFSGWRRETNTNTTKEVSV